MVRRVVVAMALLPVVLLVPPPPVVIMMVVGVKLGGVQNLEHNCSVSTAGNPNRKGSIRCKHTGQDGSSRYGNDDEGGMLVVVVVVVVVLVVVGVTSNCRE
jgi:hypothetical protein